MDERRHLLERLLSRRGVEVAQHPLTLALEDGQLDLAASLAVLSDELLEVWHGVPILVGASQAQDGGQSRALAARQHASRGRFGHGLFRLPVLVMHGHHALGHAGGWGAILTQALGIEVATHEWSGVCLTLLAGDTMITQASVPSTAVAPAGAGKAA